MAAAKIVVVASSRFVPAGPKGDEVLLLWLNSHHETELCGLSRSQFWPLFRAVDTRRASIGATANQSLPFAEFGAFIPAAEPIPWRLHFCAELRILLPARQW